MKTKTRQVRGFFVVGYNFYRIGTKINTKTFTGMINNTYF